MRRRPFSGAALFLSGDTPTPNGGFPLDNDHGLDECKRRFSPTDSCHRARASRSTAVTATTSCGVVDQLLNAARIASRAKCRVGVMIPTGPSRRGKTSGASGVAALCTQRLHEGSL